MAEGRIALSAKERERLKALHRITRGHLRQIDAAHHLRQSERQVRRVFQRLRTKRIAGLVHRLRGRPWNRKIAVTVSSSPPIQTVRLRV